jgi:hypothetical protein
VGCWTLDIETRDAFMLYVDDFLTFESTIEIPILTCSLRTRQRGFARRKVVPSISIHLGASADRGL